MNKMNLLRVIVGSVALYVLPLQASEVEERLARAADPHLSEETRYSDLVWLMMRADGLKALSGGDSAKGDSVSEGMAALFLSGAPNTRSAVVNAAVLSGNRLLYNRLRSRALCDDEPRVRMAAFGGAAVFDDRSKEVTDVIMNEIRTAKSGDALLTAATLAARFNLTEAIQPLLGVLKSPSVDHRLMAAQGLENFTALPESARPGLTTAIEEARKESIRMENALKYFPSARNPEGNTADFLVNALKRAITKITALSSESAGTSDLPSPH